MTDMPNKSPVEIGFYIMPPDACYSEAELAQNLPMINEIVTLDEVAHYEVYGALSIMYNGADILGPSYFTNLFSLPSADPILQEEELTQLFYDSLTQEPHRFSLKSNKANHSVSYQLVNSKDKTIHKHILPLAAFARAWILCQMRQSRLAGFIGDTNTEHHIRNWWYIDNQDPVLKQAKRELVGIEAAKYIMEADLAELLSRSSTK